MGTYKSTSIPSISRFKAPLSAFNTSYGQLIHPDKNNALESDSGDFLLICVKKHVKNTLNSCIFKIKTVILHRNCFTTNNAEAIIPR